MIVGSCLALVGCGLLSTLSDTTSFQASQYGYQFIFGLGSGSVFTSMVLMFSFAVEPDKVGESVQMIQGSTVHGHNN